MSSSPLTTSPSPATSPHHSHHLGGGGIGGIGLGHPLTPPPPPLCTVDCAATLDVATLPDPPGRRSAATGPVRASDADCADSSVEIMVPPPPLQVSSPAAYEVRSPAGSPGGARPASSLLMALLRPVAPLPAPTTGSSLSTTSSPSGSSQLRPPTPLSSIIRSSSAPDSLHASSMDVEASSNSASLHPPLLSERGSTGSTSGAAAADDGRLPGSESQDHLHPHSSTATPPPSSQPLPPSQMLLTPTARGGEAVGSRITASASALQQGSDESIQSTMTAPLGAGVSRSSFVLRDPRVRSIDPLAARDLTPDQRLAALSSLIQSFADLSGSTPMIGPDSISCSDLALDVAQSFISGSPRRSSAVAAPSTATTGTTASPRRPFPPLPPPPPAVAVKLPTVTVQLPVPRPTGSSGSVSHPGVSHPGTEMQLGVHAMRSSVTTTDSDMYVVQKTLVEGQAGKIKLATHSLTGEQVVIKCLDKSTLTLDPAAWRAAMREIAVTASLNHPHIAPLLQVLDSPAAVQLVFTFEPGGDLLEFLVAHARDRTALVERKARESARSMAAAAVAASASAGGGSGSGSGTKAGGPLSPPPSLLPTSSLAAAVVPLSPPSLSSPPLTLSAPPPSTPPAVVTGSVPTNDTAAADAVQLLRPWVAWVVKEQGGQLPVEFRGGMSEARTQHLAAQVVNALEHCHSRGIVHRDLKPDNILINTAGHVQLIDFGFTNVLDEEAELMSTFCGSLAYAAPEMLAKQPYVGMPVDVWSLGVTLFVLVSGYLPFDEGNVARMYQHMMASDIEFPESMSPELKHMLKRMMDPDPTTRPTMREVQQFAWFDAERRVSPQLFVPSAARPDDGSPPPLMRVHPETLVAMAARWPRSFPDVARTRTCVETRTPSHEFATYMLMLERARRDAAVSAAANAAAASAASASPRPRRKSTDESTVTAASPSSGSVVDALSEALARSLSASLLAPGPLNSSGGSTERFSRQASTGSSPSSSRAASRRGSFSGTGTASAGLTGAAAAATGQSSSGPGSLSSTSPSSSAVLLGEVRWHAFARHSLTALEQQLDDVAERWRGEGGSEGESDSDDDRDGTPGNAADSAAATAGLGIAHGSRPAKVAMTIVEEDEEEQD